MDIHKFYPLQEPQPEELDEAVVDSVYNLLKRFGLVVTPGIVPVQALYALTKDLRWLAMMPGGIEFNITQNGNFAFNIGPGMGFSRNAVSSAGTPQDVTNQTDLRLERVFITSAEAAVVYDVDNPTATDVLGNATPRSSGCTAIPVLPSRTYYVYLRYLSQVDTTSNIPGTLGNKYTLNPQTGQVQYVHYVDGYQVVLTVNSPSTDVDNLYIGTVVVGASAITSITTSGRSYLSIPGSIVRSEVRTDQTAPFNLRPSGYTADTQITFTDHINAVSDLSVMDLYNPHGITMRNIPGLLDRFGMYSDAPEDFFTNGIVDHTTDANTNRPGPYWAYLSGLDVFLKYPVTGQAAVIDQYRYDSTSAYYSEVVDAGVLVLENVPGVLKAEFVLSSALRPTGYYFLYLERAIVGSVAGLALRAELAERYDLGPVSLLDMMYNPGDYLDLTTQFPVGIVNFSSVSGFIPFTSDPQTRYSAASFYVMDVRKYGTISESNVSHDRRSYTDSASEVPQAGILSKNREVYSDHFKWIVQGPAAVMTTRPVVQGLAKKVGRIRRISMFSDTIPTGLFGLSVDVKINGTTSIFSTLPMITSGRTANATGYTGATGAVLMDITENPAVAPNVGVINSDTNYVKPGDRIQLFISAIGSIIPGGDDMLLMVYIE